MDKESQQRLEFFRSLPPSEQVRLAMWFHQLIENDVAGLYEWKQAQARAAVAGWSSAAIMKEK